MSSFDWMHHDTTPRDPYNRGEHGVRNLPIPSATYSRIPASGKTSEIGTGIMRPRPADDADHRRQGFYKDPDWHSPRQHQHQRPSSKRFGREHVVTKMAQSGQTVPRARPGEAYKVFAGEARAAESRLTGIDPGDGSVIGPQFYRSKNDEWKTYDEVRKDFAPDRQRRDEFRQAIIDDQQRRAMERQARDIERQKDAKLLGSVPVGADRRSGAGSATKKYPNEPLEARNFRTSRKLDAVPGFHKPKNIELAEPSAVSRQKINTEVFTQDGADCGVRYENHPEDRESRRRKQKDAAATFDSQIYEDQLRRAAAAEEDRRAANADHGFVQRLAEASHETPSNGKRVVTITGPRRAKADSKLASELKMQIQDETNKKKADEVQYRGRDTQYQHDPFSQPYDLQNKIKGNVRRHCVGESRDPVPGASLVNTMDNSMKSGRDTTPNGSHRFPRAPNFEDMEYEKELRAQRHGQSEWGRPGAGNANYDADGHKVTQLYAVIEAEQTGKKYERNNPEYKRKQQLHKRDMQNLLAEQRRERVREHSNHKNPVDASLVNSLQLRERSIRTDGRRKQQGGEVLLGTRNTTIRKDDGLKRDLDAQIVDREERRQRDRAKAREGAVSLVDQLASHDASARGRPKPKPDDGFHIGELRNRPILLQDPEETERLRSDLETDISARRQRRREMRERKLREEEKHVQHGTLPGVVRDGRPQRDKHGHVKARRKPLDNEIRTRAMAAPTLI